MNEGIGTGVRDTGSSEELAVRLKAHVAAALARSQTGRADTEAAMRSRLDAEDEMRARLLPVHRDVVRPAVEALAAAFDNATITHSGLEERVLGFATACLVLARDEYCRDGIVRMFIPVSLLEPGTRYFAHMRDSMMMGSGTHMDGMGRQMMGGGRMMMGAMPAGTMAMSDGMGWFFTTGN